MWFEFNRSIRGRRDQLSGNVHPACMGGSETTSRSSLCALPKSDESADEMSTGRHRTKYEEDGAILSAVTD